MAFALTGVPHLAEHEVIVAQSARQMILTGDWLIPRYLDTPFLVKPPLAAWLVASIPALLPPNASSFVLDVRLDARLLSDSIAGADQSESTTITVRIDPRMLARIKRVARSRYLNYQSMIKQWLSERMEQEFRRH